MEQTGKGDKYFPFNPRKALLIDGLGACLSAAMLGLVLPAFQSAFGMPIRVLYLLAGFAMVFAIYSLGSYWFRVKQPGRFLRGIAVANLLYCALTLMLTIWYSSMLTVFGMGYFAVEILVVSTLAIWELRTASNTVPAFRDQVQAL